MNKDDIILKYQQMETNDLEDSLELLKENNEKQYQQLKMLQDKLNRVSKGQKDNKLKKIFKKKTVVFSKVNYPNQEVSYEKLYEIASNSLLERGLDPESIDYAELVSQEEIDEITRELNKALPREHTWKKSDFIVVFVAAIVGGVADFVLSNRNNDLTGQHSKFSEWLNDTFHEGKHASNAPIDYQGKGFGGGYHRELSKGHDLLRFVEGIKSFKDGQFTGIRYIDGIPQKIVLGVNQYGNPYNQLSIIEAILRYSEHMFADLFSKVSLPFPGYSFLRESNHRDLRKLSADMYHNGFNCKNVIIQSVSTIIIELIIRLYFSICSVKSYKKEFEIDENYSNIEAIKQFINPIEKEKLYEMLLVAHAIVTGINIGKITINKNLAEINITEIIAVVRYGSSVATAFHRRNSEIEKTLYYSGEVSNKWNELYSELSEEECSIPGGNTLIIE